MSYDKYDYNEAVQQRIVSLLLLDTDFYIQSAEVVKPEFFDNPALGDMVKVINGFFDNYNRVPSYDEFLEEFSVFISSNRVPEDEYLNVAQLVLSQTAEGEEWDYIKDKAVDFARFQAVKGAIERSPRHLERKDYSTILKEVRDGISIGESMDDMGLFYCRTTEERFEKRVAGNTRGAQTISTGLASLDIRLGGGIAPSELFILMGPMKRGKTTVAVNFSYGALLQGYSVVHFGFEGSETRTGVMYDAKISGISKTDLTHRDETIREEANREASELVKEFLKPSHIGDLVIKHFPAITATAQTLESYLQRLKAIHQITPTLLVIDYLTLMIPADRSALKDNRPYIIGQIVKEILSLGQRYNYATWLLHQSTTGSLSKKTIGLADTAHSAEPMRDADGIITVSQTEEEYEMEPEKIRLYIAGAREVSDHQTIPFAIDRNLVRVFEEDVNV